MRPTDQHSLASRLKISLALLLCSSLVMLPGCGEDSPTAEPPVPVVTVEISSPTTGSSHVEGDDISFAGTATDPDGQALTGGDLVWTSDVDGQIGTGEAFTSDELAEGSHTITLTATDSDDHEGTADVTITVTQGVVATIVSPENDDILVEGEDITFTGSGTDPFGGALTGASLVWTTAQGGDPLGTGETFTDQLAVDDHTIILTATDGDGRIGTDSVNITVAPAVTATITSPTPSGTYDEFTAVMLSGSAQTYLGVPLTGDSLSWRSSIGGVLGTGTSLLATLPEGAQNIILVATDDQGRYAYESVAITVTGDGVMFNLAGDWSFTSFTRWVSGSYFTDPGAMDGFCTILQVGAVISLSFTDGYLPCDPVWICAFDGTGSGVYYDLGNSGVVDNVDEYLTNALELISGTATLLEGEQTSVYEHQDGTTSSIGFSFTFTKIVK